MDGVPVPCWFPVCGLPVSLGTVPCGGAFVVVAVELRLVGKTGLVEVFAGVWTNELGGIASFPVLMEFAFSASDADPVPPLAAAVVMLFCTCGATLMVLLMIVVL